MGLYGPADREDLGVWSYFLTCHPISPVCSEMTLVMCLPLLFGKCFYSSIRCFKLSYSNCFPLLGTPVVYISRAERSPSEIFYHLPSTKRHLYSRLGGEINALLNQNLCSRKKLAAWNCQVTSSPNSEGCLYDWLLNKCTCKTPILMDENRPL